MKSLRSKSFDQPAEARRRARRRVHLIEVAAVAFLTALVVRAAQVQLVEGRRYLDAARASRTERVELEAPRGAIRDRHGAPLALSQNVYHVNVTPAELTDRARVTRELAKQLDLSVRSVERRLRRRYAYFRGPYTSAQVQPLRALRGVYLESEVVRFHPNQTLASSLLGRPGVAGRPASGMERMFDTLLAGRPGSAVVLRDQFGRQYESPARLDAFPTPGHDVLLTLDLDLQDMVERALADAIERMEAQGGDVIMLDPRTGEVLAMASRKVDGSTPARALTSVFEPGSTAKVFTAAALLMDSLVTPADSVWGEGGRYKMETRVIHDEHDEGWMDLGDVIKRSSNIGIAKFAQRLQPERQYEVLRAFGVGALTGIEFPSEANGILRRPDEWSTLSPASLAMGYEVAVTMLQLAQSYAAIANDGVMMQPTIVSRVFGPDGKVLFENKPEPVRRVVRADVAATIRAMLRDVVYAGGTGEAVALTMYEVAGKTGTARRAVNGVYVPGSYTTTFVALFPASDPQFVLAVKLDDPKSVYAAGTAAPLARSVLEQVLGGRTSILDRAKLNGNSQFASQADPPVVKGMAPYVFTWPHTETEEAPETAAIPNVAGETLRRAAHRLHEQGFRVRIQGWGPVRRTEPAAGTRAALGSVVTMHGRETRGGVD